MVTRDDAIKLAQECIDWSRKVETEAERQQFLKMAAAWTQVATEREAAASAMLCPQITKH
jgi:hypothetical protein